MAKLRTLLWSAAALGILACKQEAPAPTPIPSPHPAPAVHGAQSVGSSQPVTSAPAASGLPAAPSGPTGTIAGVIQFQGPVPKLPPLPAPTEPACEGVSGEDRSVEVHDGKLANVLVRITDPSLKVAGPSTPVVVDQKHCTYTPRVQGAVLGQKLEIRNEDPTLHNVHTYEDHRSLFNNAQPPGAPAIVKPLPNDEGVVRVKCDVHEWMLSYVVVGHNPYFSVSDAQGRFEIDHVPPGKYTLQAWQERYGTRVVPVEVKPNQTSQVRFSFAEKDDP